MIKILYYLRALNIGGAETFIFNVLERLDTQLYHIDIALQSNNNENIRLLELCEQKGVKIFYTCPFERNYLRSYKQLLNIVNENGYDVIHLHANSLINNIPVRVARKTHCKLVVHSHNSNNNEGGFVGKTVHYINRWIMNRGEVVRLSCSDKAGKWMFADRKYELVNNGINLDNYKYNLRARVVIRNRLGLSDDTIVWGHVARFVEAKNHVFLIKCFEYYNRKNPNSKLLLLGDGPLFEKIKNNTKNSNVIFLGSITDTSEYYSVFDVMVFPSLFEGLPFTLVEAQASGLPILASDNVTKLVNISGLIRYLSLDETIESWCASLPKILSDEERYVVVDTMQNSVFDSKVTVEQITKCYKK